MEDVRIDIIDTQENSRIMLIESAEANSIKLHYNSSDSLFAGIISSKFSLSMLVKDSADRNFNHLITYSEKRYLLKYFENETLVWEGYLLPEQFSEEYLRGGYFVNFVFTDGVGLLKNQYLPDGFYNGRHSIYSLIKECLKGTLLNYDLVYIPAIKNSFLKLNLNDLEVDTLSFVEVKDGKSVKKDAYDILNDLVVFLGCKLFVYSERWYLFGFSRFSENIVNSELYGFVDDLKTDYTIKRSGNYLNLLAPSYVEFFPGFKMLNLEWEKKERKNLFLDPFTVIDYSLNPAVDGVKNENLDLRYAGVSLGLDFSNLYEDSLNDFSGNLITYSPNTFIVPDKLFLSLFGQVTSLDELDVNFFEFTDKVYVDKDRELTLEIHFNVQFWDRSKEQVMQQFEEGFFKQRFLYKLFFYSRKDAEGDVVFSNVPGSFAESGLVDFSYSINSSDKNLEYLEGKLKVEKIKIPVDGYFNLRLYPFLQEQPATVRIRYTKIEFNIDARDVVGYECVSNLERSIVKSTKYFHGTENMNTTNRRLYVREGYEVNVPVNVPGFSVQLDMLEYNLSDLNMLEIIVDVKEYGSFIKGEIRENNLYLKRAGIGSLELIKNYYAFVRDDGRLVVRQMHIPGFGDMSHFINENDVIFLLKEPEQYVLNSSDYYLNTWSRIYFEDSLSWLDVLNRMHFDCLNDGLYKLTGDIVGKVTPLDILGFGLYGEKLFCPIDIEFNIDTGESSVELLELKRVIYQSYEK